MSFWQNNPAPNPAPAPPKPAFWEPDAPDPEPEDQAPAFWEPADADPEPEDQTSTFWQPTSYLDFEVNLENWEGIGNVGIYAGDGGQVVPTSGNFMAALISNGSIAAEVEAFLGIEPGSLDELIDGDATNGSAIQTTVPVADVETTEISFDWYFGSGDAGSAWYNDFSFYAITNGNLALLASASELGWGETTGWQTITFDSPVEEGQIEIGFGVFNFDDQAVDAFLFVDNIIVEDQIEPEAPLPNLWSAAEEAEVEVIGVQGNVWNSAEADPA